MPAFKDLTKREFGKLVVIERAENAKNGGVRWKCRCKCNKIITVRSDHLLSGGTQSCGCLAFEIASKAHTTHGMCETREYITWHSMIQRCNNPKDTAYHNYGGRGITVCDKWLKFVGFFEDMGNCQKGLTIERKNNDFGYNKENCFWADRTVQARNRRIQKNNKTGTPGVWWEERRKKYRVSIKIGNNKTIHIGYFIELDQAAKARKVAELKYWKRGIIMFNIGDMVQDSDDCLGIVGINYLDGDFVTTEMDVAHLSPQLCKWDDDRRSLVERRNQPKKLTFDEYWREHRDWLVTIYNSEPDPNIAVMEIAEAGWRGARNAK